MMILSIVIALMGQYWFYDSMADVSGAEDAWTVGCESSSDKYPRCREYGVTYRVSFAASCFFVVMAMVSAASPPLHDYGWDVKIIGYVLYLVGLIWAPNYVFDNHGYLWIARVGAFIFIVLQQIILIDFAYTLNETLKNLGSIEDEWNQWLALLLGISCLLYATAITGIVLLFVYYSDCSDSATFISVTLVCIVGFTILQLVSDPEHGHNILGSGVVATYAVYLTYVSVSSNPDKTCNPTYSDANDATAIVLGLGITFLSICGTVYFSSKSITGLVSRHSADLEANRVTKDLLTSDMSTLNPASSPTGADAASPSASGAGSAAAAPPSDDGGTAWRFNVVMMLISMQFCMVLTDWGNVERKSNAASPTNGRVAMWINITASWICVLLYTWTLIAPRIFPDRDFS